MGTHYISCRDFLVVILLLTSRRPPELAGCQWRRRRFRIRLACPPRWNQLRGHFRRSGLCIAYMLPSKEDMLSCSCKLRCYSLCWIAGKNLEDVIRTAFLVLRIGSTPRVVRLQPQIEEVHCLTMLLLAGEYGRSGTWQRSLMVAWGLFYRLFTRKTFKKRS